MIDGIKIVMSSQELKTHLEERASHHGSKAAWYATKATEIREGAPETAVNNDPAHALERNAENHEAQAHFFEFLAAHIPPDEIYRLDKADLEQLEFVSHHYMQ